MTAHPKPSRKQLMRRAEAAEAQVTALRAVVARFVSIADEAQAAADETWSRARRAQEAAALARAGKKQEAHEAIAWLDKAPRVHDFSRTVGLLTAAAGVARAALAGRKP
jgi:vacuolar-type H+-ATPase subunit D/Vma8